MNTIHCDNDNRRARLSPVLTGLGDSVVEVRIRDHQLVLTMSAYKVRKELRALGWVF
jgi:hypothetical protein